MLNRLEARLRRIERRHRPALPQVATCIRAVDAADAEHQLAGKIEAGTHRLGWPLLVITSAVFQEDHT